MKFKNIGNMLSISDTLLPGRIEIYFFSLLNSYFDITSSIGAFSKLLKGWPKCMLSWLTFL